MNELARKRMRVNLIKALAWIVGGAIAIAVVEWAWDAGYIDGKAHAEEGQAVSSAPASTETAFTYEALSAFAFQDDDAAVGVASEVPADFTAECFSPASMGSTQVTEEGSVVGIVSDVAADELYPLCADALQAHGWLKVESGQERRSSFVKGEGRYRWLFLDVTPSAEGSIAVVVLREEQ